MKYRTDSGSPLAAFGKPARGANSAAYDQQDRALRANIDRMIRDIRSQRRARRRRRVVFWTALAVTAMLGSTATMLVVGGQRDPGKLAQAAQAAVSSLADRFSPPPPEPPPLRTVMATHDSGIGIAAASLREIGAPSVPESPSAGPWLEEANAPDRPEAEAAAPATTSALAPLPARPGAALSPAPAVREPRLPLGYSSDMLLDEAPAARVVSRPEDEEPAPQVRARVDVAPLPPATLVSEAPASATPANTQAAPEDAASGSAAGPARPAGPPADQIAALMSRAAELIRIGDIGGARRVLEYAGSGGDGTALLALAETYDPAFLDQWGVRGVRPDVARARALYLRAAEGGAVSARERLASLR